MAVEVFRNGEAYQIAIDLPYGAEFVPNRIDRTFEIKGVEGNLRLIQDSYTSCAALIAERQANKAAEGFTTVLSSKAAPRDCAIKLANPATGQISSSFYTYMDSCKCYSALQLTSDEASEPVRKQIVQGLLDQIRANNPPALGSSQGGGASSSGASRDGAEWNEYLTCDQKRARGITVSENEYDTCGPGKKAKPPANDAKALKAELIKRLREKLQARDGDNEAKLRAQRAELQRLLDKALLAAKQKREQAEAAAKQKREQAEAAARLKAQQTSAPVRVVNDDRYTVQLVFFSQSKKRQWTAGALAPGQEYATTLNCATQEKICFGAWREDATWGAGPKNDLGCKKCCFLCGTSFSTTLMAAPEPRPPPPPPPPRQSPSADAEALNSFLSGINAGLQIYNAYRGASGGGGGGGGNQTCVDCSSISGGN